MKVSLFNDVLGPVMRGPSSSHCAAAWRIGRLALDLMEGEIESVLIEFDRGGSLPATHESQGSDMGLFGGLLGMEVVDSQLPDSPRLIQESGIDIRIETVDVGDPHPNTYRMKLSGGGKSHELIAISTGGGMIEVIAIDGVKVSMFGDYHVVLVGCDQPEQLKASIAQLGPGTFTHSEVYTGDELGLLELKVSDFPDQSQLEIIAQMAGVKYVRKLSPVLPVLSRKDLQVPFSTAAELIEHDAEQDQPLWRYALEYECARGAMSEDEVMAKMHAIVDVVRASINEGIAGTSYEDRILGHQSGGYEKAMAQGTLLDGGLLNRAVMYVTALMEVKSSMGLILAAPTAGACAAFPGMMVAAAEEMNASDDMLAKSMLAGGVIGLFIAEAYTFAAEVGGCQAESGSAAGMTAAGLVTLQGGGMSKALAAASMAIQNTLGLICDPVANRVEAPCLGKNVTAAANALCCANMAIANFDAVIPLDEVIASMRSVGEMMARELRCTGLGGLAATPTSKAIELKLASCGTGCGGGACG